MHGGDWAAYEREYGRRPLDFSANISPLGVPASVQEAVKRAAEEADRYPDPFCRELREAIAGREEIPVDYVLCGNGAADLIWRLAAACRFGRALLPVPSFAEYEAALQANACEVEHYALREKEDFRLTEGFLTVLREFLYGGHATSERTDKRKLVVLCEPGNPSGVTTDPALLREILADCARAGALLFVDECFLELTDEPERHTLRSCLTEYANLFLLRAFTKTYAMAGLRLGYGMSADTALLTRLRESGPPWSVSHVAQMAGLAALADTAYRECVREIIRSGRQELQEGLAELGFRVVPGEANFLLFHAERELTEPLRERGILIRDCADFAGLSKGWYRVAVKTKEENDRLLKELKRCLQAAE